MAQYFHSKVKYLQTQESGLVKQVTEEHLIDALSFTEAEARITQEIQGHEFEVVALKRSNIAEVVTYGDTGLFFSVKMTYSTVEDGEKEKKITTYLLIEAESVEQAYERAQDHCKEWLVPFQLPEVKETKIKEVFQHVAGLRVGLRKVETHSNEEE